MQLKQEMRRREELRSRALTMWKEGEYALDDNGDSFGHVASRFQLSYRWGPNPPAARFSGGGLDR